MSQIDPHVNYSGIDWSLDLESALLIYNCKLLSYFGTEGRDFTVLCEIHNHATTGCSLLPLVHITNFGLRVPWVARAALSLPRIIETSLAKIPGR